MERRRFLVASATVTTITTAVAGCGIPGGGGGEDGGEEGGEEGGGEGGGEDESLGRPEGE